MSYPYESKRVTKELAAQAIQDLKELIAIKSLSLDPKYKPECVKAAEFLQNFLQQIDFQVEMHQTPGMPIVYAEKLHDPSLPTVLIYGHYDVMPADEPGWESEPFTLIEKDGNMIGRGTSDDKGQVMIQAYALKILALENFKQVNFKIIFEGEEESGSENLEGFLQNNLEKLKADVVVVSDTSMVAEDIPGITSSVRGAMLAEVNLSVAKMDLHSGVFGGMVCNPANVMANLISAIKTKDGKIALPGFYDQVLEYDEAFKKDLQLVDELCFDQKVLDNFAISTSAQEQGYTPFEGATIRPSFDINGIKSGFTETGSKTIIPRTCMAKFSFRLVANQDPAKIEKDFKDFVEQFVPEEVDVRIQQFGYYYPYATDTKNQYLQLALETLTEVFEQKAYLVPCGGSIPIGALFKNAMNIETVFLGFGLETDNIHGPNECLSVKNFLRGMEVLCEYYKKIASKRKQ